ncbi:hypothetical protein [Trichloromonas sp.]|uniref:hypothetical protein n=1 Tax=Trichloromonas sp. TaxID=3069249 RepID=UPI002A4C48D8|nr:hypothetical protein [Trichloromonas sp.]
MLTTRSRHPESETVGKEEKNLFADAAGEEYGVGLMNITEINIISADKRTRCWRGLRAKQGRGAFS